MSLARRKLIPTHLALVALLGLAPLALPAEPTPPPARKYSNVERLALPRLKAAHEDVLKIRSRRVQPPSLPGLNDYRCIFHAHAEDSAHTGGTLPEMLTDAKKAAVNAIFLADHFRPPRDFIEGRWRGLKEGVLFIPGSESRGALLHPENSVLSRMEDPFPELAKAVAAGDGLIFLSHIEERVEQPLEGLTGLEIYNRHWDAKKDMASLIAVAMKLTDPKQLAELQEAARLYPDELLGFQCDHPQVYLDKWDAGTKTLRLTGVAANDCHHNQVFLVKMVDAETVLLGTNVDKDEAMRKLTASTRPGIKEMTANHQPGDILARIDIDPYERSFWNSSTHVLAAKLDETTLRVALKSGRAYVSHDWMCDPTGFRYEVFDGNGKTLGIMGDEMKYADSLKVRALFPVFCHARLLRNGVQTAEVSGQDRVEFGLDGPGAYRVEAWLKIDGEERPWIYSNPIYLR